MNYRKINLSDTSLQTAINIFTSLVATGIGFGINFFLSPFIVETLGSEANGFIQLANNFIMYASLVTITLNSMAGRFISVAYHKNEKSKASAYYTSTIVGNIIIVLLFILPAIFCVSRLELLINITHNVNDVKMLFAFLFVNFFVGQLFSIFGVATYVTNRLYISNVLNAIKQLLNAILLALVFTLFLPRLYYVSVISVVLTALNAIAAFKVKSHILCELTFDINFFKFGYVKELIFSGIWNTLNQAGNILMTGFDLLIANLFIDPIQMGVLAISKTMPTQIIQLGSLVNGNFSPSVTMSYAKGNKVELLNKVRTSMKISSVFLSIPIMVFTVFGLEFYGLWMPDIDSRELLILSVLNFLAFIPCSGTQALYNIFTSMNRLKFNAVTFLANGIINIVLVLLLLNYTDLGVYAVAGVSSITTIVRILTFTLPYTAKLLNLKWYVFYKDIGISLLCALLCYLVSSFVKVIIPPDNWLLLVVSVVVASVFSLVLDLLIFIDINILKKFLTKLLRSKNNG